MPVKDVRKMLESFPTLDGVSRLVVVIAAIGMFGLGVLIVEALLRLFILVIVLVAKTISFQGAQSALRFRLQ